MGWVGAKPAIRFYVHRGSGSCLYHLPVQQVALISQSDAGLDIMSLVRLANLHLEPEIMSWSEFVQNLPALTLFIGAALLIYVTYQFSKLP